MSYGFEARRDIDMSAPNTDYYLHTHLDKHEILLFMDGACEFHIEGNVYTLSPYDMVIASTNELHRIVITAPHRYDRYILYIDADYFAKNDCRLFSRIFEEKLPGVGCYYSGDFVRSAGILELMDKIYTYASEGEQLVASGVMLELLYKLNRAKISEASDHHSDYVRGVITYINENLTSDLRMKTLAAAFHINDEYLGRLFKKQMKISVKEYITYKRLLYARLLYHTGKSLLEASLEAGFSNYSVFYRMYMKEFGQSPRLHMKH